MLQWLILARASVHRVASETTERRSPLFSRVAGVSCPRVYLNLLNYIKYISRSGARAAKTARAKTRMPAREPGPVAAWPDGYFPILTAAQRTGLGCATADVAPRHHWCTWQPLRSAQAVQPRHSRRSAIRLPQGRCPSVQMASGAAWVCMMTTNETRQTIPFPAARCPTDRAIHFGSGKRCPSSMPWLRWRFS